MKQRASFIAGAAAGLVIGDPTNIANLLTAALISAVLLSRSVFSRQHKGEQT